jgi:hypothetical protein
MVGGLRCRPGGCQRNRQGAFRVTAIGSNDYTEGGEHVAVWRVRDWLDVQPGNIRQRLKRDVLLRVRPRHISLSPCAFRCLTGHLQSHLTRHTG